MVIELLDICACGGSKMPAQKVCTACAEESGEDGSDDPTVVDASTLRNRRRSAMSRRWAHGFSSLWSLFAVASLSSSAR